MFIVTLFFAVSTVSFEESTFQIAEESGLSVAITVTRSGDIDREAIVLVASDNIRGTASGECNS